MHYLLDSQLYFYSISINGYKQRKIKTLLQNSYYDDAERALDEAKIAINKILDGAEKNIELRPQNQQIRKLQHELVEQYGMQSTSIGEGESRHLRVSK